MNLNDVKKYIKSDLFRYTGQLNTKSFLKAYIRNRSFRYSFWLRACKIQNRVLRMIARIMHDRLSRKFGIQIPHSTQIGYGLYIAHGMALVVNPTAVIGNNCNLSQFTTIGANHGKAATIGDSVYIGPGVSIVEDVKIGTGVTIGAGAVVVKDIPDYATSAGVPAKVISHHSHAKYIKNPWPL